MQLVYATDYCNTITCYYPLNKLLILINLISEISYNPKHINENSKTRTCTILISIQRSANGKIINKDNYTYKINLY